MLIWAIILFIIGLVIIVKGGDWFVEAAVWVAEVTGVPKMLIGATVVSLATTLPEFFVSVIAVADGATGLGIGNALGSVICNTGLILALSIAIKPSKVDKPLFYKKFAIMFAAFVVLAAALWDRTLSPWESIPLFVIFGVFIHFNIRHVRKGSFNRQKEIAHIDTTRRTVGINILKFAAGAAGIVIGADLLVNNGIKIASWLGVSDGIIGVTVVALGTSLPELVTTITALRKKESAMGIGNILGANILNFTMILSTCALVSGGGLKIQLENMPMLSRVLPRTLYIDMAVVGVLFILLILPPLIFKGRLKRLQGILMLAVYAAFITFLVLNI